jgi:hypothetical protein
LGTSYPSAFPSQQRQAACVFILAFLWRSFVTSRSDACYFAIAGLALSTPVRILLDGNHTMNRSTERILTKETDVEEATAALEMSTDPQ